LAALGSPRDVLPAAALLVVSYARAPREYGGTGVTKEEFLRMMSALWDGDEGPP
jgi:hypothetical protein